MESTASIASSERLWSAANPALLLQRRGIIQPVLYGRCGHDNNGILQAKRSAYSIPLLIYWLHLCEIKSTQRLIGKELNN